jgi:thiol-disulfide isomerase/thioredoxin
MPDLRGSAPAPEFPPRLEWLNVDRPLRLADLRGKVVVLEFWTSCCVNCHHNARELERLAERFPQELVVVGVHAAKFPAEKLAANVREAILRHGLGYPVVNDPALDLWQRYGVRAWPTIVVIDPAGNYIGSQSGEVAAEELAPLVAALAAEFESSGELDRSPVGFRLPAVAGRGALRYPSKLLASEDGKLFVADTGHHRVLELVLASDLSHARVSRVFGSGEAGLTDGVGKAARFRRPHGLARIGQTLWVADTENHALRSLDLATGAVRTIAGNGRLGRGRQRFDRPLIEIALRSPWALVPHEGDSLLVAMAGSHQIWEWAEGRLAPFAGSGQEALVDGSVLEACFNQPSDLAVAMGHLFVADAEASAIRVVSLGADPRVHTVVGQGLFEWGDADGEGARARLQHPTGLAARGDRLYLADSYNHKLKELEPASGRVQTLVGSGVAGHGDGALLRAQFFQPEGLSWALGRLFVADTNNHAIRVVDVERRAVTTLEIADLLPPAKDAATEEDGDGVAS